MTTAIRPADRTWLHMDRPNNLMHIHGLLRFDERPEWQSVEEVIRERLLDRFPVFQRRAVQVGGIWAWEDDPDFSLANHLRHVRLPDDAGAAGEQDYISARFSQPFDKSRPLWEVDFVEGAARTDGTRGGAMLLARFHHGLADGIRLVQVLLSLLDPVDPGSSAAPAAVGRSSSGGSPSAMAGGLVKHVATGTADFVTGVGAALTRAPAWVAQVNPRHLPGVAVAGPTVVDAVTGVASEENRLANTWRSVGRLALSGRTTPTLWQGTPGVEKRVAWVSGLQLDDVRRVGRSHGVTVNDVLLAGVSLGITEYLADKGALDTDLVQWLVPVSLKPIDNELPRDLGNHFALVMLPMPLGITNPHHLLRELHSRMNRIKNSAEPAILFGVQRTIAETPPAVSVPITNYVANKSVGVLTNVPGPRAPMALAGVEVTGILGWVPTSGDQPLGLCIFTFNGAVSIGVAADAALVPDPDELARHIDTAIRHLATLHHRGSAQA